MSAPPEMIAYAALTTIASTGPYGAVAGAPRWALQARRFLHDTGQDETDLGAIVVNNRQMAQHNPRAAFYGKPFTLDDYFDAEMISSPLRIVDCDMPVDARSVILTSDDMSGDLPHHPAFIATPCSGPSLRSNSHSWSGATGTTTRTQILRERPLEPIVLLHAYRRGPVMLSLASPDPRRKGVRKTDTYCMLDPGFRMVHWAW
ncbi:hypothetical protein [Rhodococcus sp. WAY2]|uniref:hypothetical protein n=1 Tax=Rhodococcus sp. WAY2 TaxID=2663121 RepID=UPI0013596142|nr:hypothetical protein [Rhodococcus sp. WAY2]